MDDHQHTDYNQDLKAFLSASYWSKKLINYYKQHTHKIENNHKIRLSLSSKGHTC